MLEGQWRRSIGRKFSTEISPSPKPHASPHPACCCRVLAELIIDYLLSCGALWAHRCQVLAALSNRTHGLSLSYTIKIVQSTLGVMWQWAAVLTCANSLRETGWKSPSSITPLVWTAPRAQEMRKWRYTGFLFIYLSIYKYIFIYINKNPPNPPSDPKTLDNEYRFRSPRQPLVLWHSTDRFSKFVFVQVNQCLICWPWFDLHTLPYLVGPTKNTFRTCKTFNDLSNLIDLQLGDFLGAWGYCPSSTTKPACPSSITLSFFRYFCKDS